MWEGELELLCKNEKKLNKKRAAATPRFLQGCWELELTASCLYVKEFPY